MATFSRLVTNCECNFINWHTAGRIIWKAECFPHNADGQGCCHPQLDNRKKKKISFFSRPIMKNESSRSAAHQSAIITAALSFWYLTLLVTLFSLFFQIGSLPHISSNCVYTLGRWHVEIPRRSWAARNPKKCAYSTNVSIRWNEKETGHEGAESPTAVFPVEEALPPFSAVELLFVFIWRRVEFVKGPL